MPDSTRPAKISSSPYRHTGHYTLIGDNGAILIAVLIREQKDGVTAIVGERIELDKAGADGRHIRNLE